MTVGTPVNAMTVDSTAGSLSRVIEQWASDVLQFKKYLDATPDDTLAEPPFSYTNEDIAILKSGFNDLALLANIYYGNATIDTARDLGIFSRRMAGIVL